MLSSQGSLKKREKEKKKVSFLSKPGVFSGADTHPLDGAGEACGDVRVPWDVPLVVETSDVELLVQVQLRQGALVHTNTHTHEYMQRETQT